MLAYDGLTVLKDFLCTIYNFKSFFWLVFLDQVFSPSATNDDVYTQIAAPIVRSAMEGFNGWYTYKLLIG